MNCKQVLLILDSYVDQELQPREMAIVREHLCECRECRMEERESRALKALLGHSDAPEPSVDFEDRLVAHVMGAQRVEAKRPVRTFRFGMMLGASAAAAAMTFVVIALTKPSAWILPRPRNRRTSNP